MKKLDLYVKKVILNIRKIGPHMKKIVPFMLKSMLFMFVFTFIVLLFVYTYAISQEPMKIPENQTIELYDINENVFLSMNNGKKSTYVDIEDISPNLINAVLSIEDKNFYNHNGFDLKRIIKAAYVDIRSGKRKEGGSTITQQYAKNLYLSNEKTWHRKAIETYYTIQIEEHYTKDEILEGYLNTIPFGHGINGVEDATLFYFNKSVTELTIEEAAVLAAIPKGPDYYSPINDFELNKQRKELVLKSMYQDGYITKDEYEASLEVEIIIHGVHPKTDDDFAPYYQDVVLKELDRLGYFNNENYKKLKVYTTLNPNVNKIIIDAINDNKVGDIEAAVVAMDPRTGYVIGLVGGIDYQTSQFNRATDAFRQPGSTIKPFLYYSALEYGFTPMTTFKSQQTTFYVNNGTEKYAPTNFADIYLNREITMAYAIAVSDNIYAVKTHLFLGEQNLVNTLYRFGFTGDIQPVPSLALGTHEVSLEQLTTGYAYFASEGKKIEPVYILKIYDEDNNLIFLNGKKNNKQILNKENTFILNDLLTGIFDTNMTVNISVTGSSLAPRLKHTYSAKSGSTDYDNWIVGYNPNIIVGVWSGYDDSSYVEIQDERKVSKNIWLDVIENYTEGKPDVLYKQPEGVNYIYINPITGEKPELGSYSKKLYYKESPFVFVN